MSSICRPRAATSVATSTLPLPAFRNVASVESRCACGRSPWMRSAAIEQACSARLRFSQRTFVDVNTKTFFRSAPPLRFLPRSSLPCPASRSSSTIRSKRWASPPGSCSVDVIMMTFWLTCWLTDNVGWRCAAPAAAGTVEM